MRPKGEVKRVADVILERIMRSTYPAGLRIPAESDLATELSCGRSTVRESLRYLESLGVLESRRGSGAIVLDYRTEGRSLDLLGPWLASSTFDQPLAPLAKELLRIRTQLACESARLAASYAKPQSMDAARAIVKRSRQLEDDPAAHAENDLALHRELATASRMLPAVWLFNAMRQPFLELTRQFPLLAIVPDDYAPRMMRLLDLVEARDADGAVALIREHLDEVDELVLSLLGPLADEPNTIDPSGRRRVAVDLNRRGRAADSKEA